MTTLDDFRSLTDLEWRSHHEAEHGMFIAEGLTTIHRALAEGLVLRSVLTGTKWVGALRALGIPDDRIIEQSDADIETLTGYAVHRGALAAFERPRMPDAETLMTSASRLIITENIVDHANIGSIMRVAAAFGFDGVVLSTSCADPLYRRAVKVSMGTVFRVTWSRADDAVHRAREHGLTTLALTPDPSAMDIRTLDATLRSHRIAVLLGSEGPGLQGSTLDQATMRVRIPMTEGVDSLNVAAASAVACYELTR